MNRLALSVLLSAFTAAATLALLSQLGPDWTQFAPATCRATHCFCETPRIGQLILQPANSWSSFGFVVLGFWIILAAQSRAVFSGLPAIWFGVTAIVIGAGSFLLHATLTLWGQFCDVVGMYLLGSFLIAYAVQRWRGWARGPTVSLYIAICTVLIAFLIVVPETRRWLFAVVLIVAIFIELTLARPRRPAIKARWFAYGIALQATAFAIWILDLSGTLCHGDSVIQGHAIWHLLNAGAVWCNHRYYLSEQRA
jgi:Ceramidase